MKSKLLVLLCICCMYFSPRAQVKLDITSGVKYATGLRNWKNKRVDSLLLDIYYPPEATSKQKYPVVVYCHGGGFTGGTRADVASDCDMLRKQGFACVAIDYRTGYQVDRTRTECNADTASLMMAIYRAMQDLNASMRFLYANADSYYLDTSNIFVSGTSAGGTLTLFDTYINDSIAQIYYSYCYNALGSLQTSGNKLPYKYNVKAIAPMWGGMPDLGLITKKSVKPTILFKGGMDKNLPDGSGHFQQCSNYPEYLAGIGVYNETIAAGAPCVYHFNPLGVHPAYDDLFCSQNIGCFFRAIMANQPYSKYLTYYIPSCQ
ncbi:alpha/beta hydrolase [Ilyomonas limi]|uniref:Alpha/beta hydrolase n=1 Tax=Ilyomonas limi TaxID=2575867 RepID=A0A4U3L8X9_9BACT|nr:alpha/beta hydrolase [Ilyomonas limi]TKK71540.1 alpha/beta hydrolase [Ilyomonas limi]